MNGIFVIAHAPLASALRQCVLHVFPDADAHLSVLDVPAHQSADETLEQARAMLDMQGSNQVLILTDVFGATPCNVATRLLDGVRVRLIAGVNLPMLLRAVSYRHEPVDALVARALLGGAQGMMPVTATAQQHPLRRSTHD